MNTKTRIHSLIKFSLRNLLALGLFSFAGTSLATGFPSTLDTFEDPGISSAKTPRLIITDAEMGGSSKAEAVYKEGILRMDGSILPARGQPGFVSLVLLLSPEGKPQNLSGYTGIEIRMRLLKGNLSILAASSEIENFDYHATPVTRSGDFRVIQVPFKGLKRMWSESTPLNLETITSINIVASGMQPGDFLYEIDSIGFYED